MADEKGGGSHGVIDGEKSGGRELMPILRRFPALAPLPRVSIGSYPTPVTLVALDDGRNILVKRDDLSAAGLGGNKVRSLEWLLGMAGSGSTVVTVGPRGSTHALTTATYARKLGSRALVVRWNQEMNAAARLVDARMRTTASVVDAGLVPLAYAIAGALRLRRDVLWIPAGGASALGVLGHVNAAMELSEQVERGHCASPDTVVVAFGTGATAAGLALGFTIAGLDVTVVAVRVVPRLLANRRRLLRLARSTAALIERVTGERLPAIARDRLRVEHGFYAGGYGRPMPMTIDESALGAPGVRLDDTYTRKAFAAVVSRSGERTMFWHTFDGRILGGKTK